MACKNCGECCASVAFSDVERHAVAKIARHMGIKWKKLLYRPSKNITKISYLPYTAKNTDMIKSLVDYQSLVDAPDIPCPFLQRVPETNQTRCACYAVRPEICREFGTLGTTHWYMKCDHYGR